VGKIAIFLKWTITQSAKKSIGAELTKTHSFRLFFWRFCHWEERKSETEQNNFLIYC